MKEFKSEQEHRQLVANRYGRQELIRGWNQVRIGNSCVAVVGSGPLANFIAVSLVGLGVGNVEIYSNARPDGSNDGEFLLGLAGKTHSKVGALENILSKINPLVNVRGIHAGITSLSLAQILGVPSAIIDVTNDPQSQEVALEYGRLNEVAVVIAVADSVRGECYVRLPHKRYSRIIGLERYKNQHQGAIPSEVLGGAVTEEIRKIIMPFNSREKPVSMLSYSVACLQRFNSEDSLAIDKYFLRDKRVLVVGAGALGNFAGIGLALAGVGNIDILDFDKVETTNLNRQVLFYDSVGDKKSKALAKMLKQINPELRIRGLVGKLDEHFACQFRLRENRPDIIFDCVDNFRTRAIINHFAVRYGIPLISGGTSPSSGQVVTYSPGESACLNCKLGVDASLGKEVASHSCIHVARPSVIMTNEIVGGMMVAEARAVLSPQNYGPHIRKMLKYDSASHVRGGLVGGDAPCDCKRGAVKEWLSEVIQNGERSTKS